MEEDDIKLVQELEACKVKLESLKGNPHYDGRGLSITITQLETAMLWFAYSRKP